MTHLNAFAMHRYGGSGVWGAIAMRPNNVPDADLKALVEWILATK
jgi:cytochrome c